jgi:hypothetical protein
MTGRNDLMVTGGGGVNKLRVVPGEDLPNGCVVVNFYREGTGLYPCHVHKPAARKNEDYLRSLIKFMQHKVPRS